MEAREFVADVFGEATEWFANEPAPYDTPDFVWGDSVSGLPRYFFAPASTFGYPCFTPDVHNVDEFGSHLAAGVGDHWFYLLAEGTNPADGQPVSRVCGNPTFTTFTGIGLVPALQILYNAMLMKNFNATYENYRFLTVVSAAMLFPGNCGILNRVRAAWDGVSVPVQSNEPTCTSPPVLDH